MYKVLCAILFGMLAITAYQVRSATSDLADTVSSLESCQDQLSQANDKLDGQNEKILEMQSTQDQVQEGREERVRIIYRNLPEQVARDTSSPADAESLNEWMGEVFSL